MLKKILTTLCVLSMVSGFLLIIGTAGASDLELISFGTLVVRSLIGTSILGGGFFGLKALNPQYFN